MDFYFIPSNDLGSDLDVSLTSGVSTTRYYDPRIMNCEVINPQDLLPALLSLWIDTLYLHFHQKYNTSFQSRFVLASKEKYPSSPITSGREASQLSLKSHDVDSRRPIHSNLGVRHPHFYPP
ncbi:hypothetical protein Tco_1243047 [Tanacetum coccineum]